MTSWRGQTRDCRCDTWLQVWHVTAGVTRRHAQCTQVSKAVIRVRGRTLGGMLARGWRGDETLRAAQQSGWITGRRGHRYSPHTKLHNRYTGTARTPNYTTGTPVQPAHQTTQPVHRYSPHTKLHNLTTAFGFILILLSSFCVICTVNFLIIWILSDKCTVLLSTIQYINFI
jgi:hypothetical protein